MNNEELKKKIAKFICNACEMGSGFDGECDIGNDYQKCSICGETANALIAAGIGDVKEVEAEANRYETLYRLQGRDMALSERRAHDAEHRAEVAERALKDVCTNVVKDEEDDLAIEPRARVLYKAYLRQAEK